MFAFQKDRLKVKDKLGKGRCGSVFPYQKHPEDLKWAVKRIKAEDADALIALLPEVVLGMSCDHPNILAIKGYFIEKISGDEGFNIYTKLPRMKGTLLGDFKQRKGENNSYTEVEITRHFYSLICGVEYLHNKKIFYGDIKPESLLLNHEGALKIGDIGILKHAEETPSMMNYQYSAPETLGVDIKKEMLRQADIWSLGVVILELCCFDLKLLNASLPKDQLQEKLNELFKSLEGRCHQSLIGLLQRILSLNPEERPDIGLIKSELENNFSEILDKDLKNDYAKNSQSQNEEKQEIFGKYEAEIKNLKEVISQFESELARKTKEFDEHFRKFDEDKTKILKDYDEALTQEREKNTKLQERLKGETQAQKALIRESYGEDYMANLQKEKSKQHPSLKDDDLSKFFKELLSTLEEKKLLNLYGIIFVVPLTWADVTDKSMENFVSLLSNESLKLHSLEIGFLQSKKLTDKSIEDLSKALIRAPYLTRLNLMFNKCTGLTDKSLGYLAETLPSLDLSILGLYFESVKGMTDSGFENLTKEIDNGNRCSQSMQTLKLTFSDSKVTSEKKTQAKKMFANVASVEIK